MFTGIIEAVGNIVDIEKLAKDYRLSINANDLNLDDVVIGDSIAVNGVCLTVIDNTSTKFMVDVSDETLQTTSLKNFETNRLVNLEKALTPSSRLGGHLVSGHVDSTGLIIAKRNHGNSVIFEVSCPNHLAKYISTKGSITIDGVSLTVNLVNGNKFLLNIIPHTIEKTIIKNYRVNSVVNLEIDLLARYLERLMLGDNAATSITTDFLHENGYIS